MYQALLFPPPREARATPYAGKRGTGDEAIYAVAVMKSGQVLGHLPRKVNRVCSIFLRRGGSISCIVLGGRRYSADLPQGGLEIPCRLLFEGEIKEIEKVTKHFKVKCITDIVFF